MRFLLLLLGVLLPLIGHAGEVRTARVVHPESFGARPAAVLPIGPHTNAWMTRPPGDLLATVTKRLRRDSGARPLLVSESNLDLLAATQDVDVPDAFVRVEYHGGEIIARLDLVGVKRKQANAQFPRQGLVSVVEALGASPDLVRVVGREDELHFVAMYGSREVDLTGVPSFTVIPAATIETLVAAE